MLACYFYSSEENWYSLFSIQIEMKLYKDMNTLFGEIANAH